MKHPVIGHSAQKRILGTIADSGNIPHAFIFTGRSGIGKRILAIQFLSSLFCLSGTKPCGTCPSCTQIATGTFPDFFTLSPNENGIIPVGQDEKDEGSIRHLIWKMSSRSASGKIGVIVDGIDRASSEAQNAFLKTLEEPVEGSCIILIASDRSQVLPTIFSRCRELRFSPLSSGEISSIIKGKTDSGVTEDFITSAADGSAETAIALCDEEKRNTVLQIARNLSMSLANGTPFNPPFQSLSRPKQGEDVLDILIHIYTFLAEESARKSSAYSALLDDIYIDDIDALRTIIKTLVSAKRARSNNVNASLHLKALAYHAFDGTGTAPPFVRDHTL